MSQDFEPGLAISDDRDIRFAHVTILNLKGFVAGDDGCLTLFGTCKGEMVGCVQSLRTLSLCSVITYRG